MGRPSAVTSNRPPEEGISCTSVPGKSRLSSAARLVARGS